MVRLAGCWNRIIAAECNRARRCVYANMRGRGDVTSGVSFFAVRTYHAGERERREGSRAGIAFIRPRACNRRVSRVHAHGSVRFCVSVPFANGVYVDADEDDRVEGFRQVSVSFGSFAEIRAMVWNVWISVKRAYELGVDAAMQYNRICDRYMSHYV